MAETLTIALVLAASCANEIIRAGETVLGTIRGAVRAGRPAADASMGEPTPS